MTLVQELTDLGGILFGFVLTLFVLSYVIKDNPLYRLAVHMLVGISAAYAVVIVVRQVFRPLWALLRDDIGANGPLWIVPLILALLLLFKALPRTAAWGNVALAALMAIGAAVALVGAIAGTLLPQLLVRHDNALIGLLMAVLTISVLAYFLFTGKATNGAGTVMPRWYRPVATLGRVVITITLAGLFSGILNTSLVLLTERIAFFVDAFGQFITDFVS
jgi:hypothetical protein